jgi:hypothetical protein
MKTFDPPILCRLARLNVDHLNLPFDTPGWRNWYPLPKPEFPELKERFAEYFLIGTLLSIGLAVLGGLALAKLWYGTISLK